MNKTTRLKRLRELHYMLKNHDKIFKPKKIRFDIESWGSKDLDYEQATLLHKSPIKKCTADVLCGYAACALGSAALYEPFTKQGLRLVQAEDSVKANKIEKDGELPRMKYNMWLEPKYGKYQGRLAGAEFFGITFKESEIFLPEAYKKKPKAGDVARRVTTLIKRYS